MFTPQHASIKYWSTIGNNAMKTCNIRSNHIQFRDKVLTEQIDLLSWLILWFVNNVHYVSRCVVTLACIKRLKI